MEKPTVRVLVIEHETSHVKDAVEFFKTVPHVEVVFAGSFSSGLGKWIPEEGSVIDQEKLQQVDSVLVSPSLAMILNMEICGMKELVDSKLVVVDSQHGRKQWEKAWELVLLKKKELA
jgi:hypothetical protein